MNMKKLVFLVLMFTLIMGVSLNATTRSFYQHIVCANPYLITDYVTNTGTTTSANYLLEAWTNGDNYTTRLATGVTPVTSLRVTKLSAAYAVAYVQFSAFGAALPVPPGAIVRMKLTYIGAGEHNGENVTWNFTVPDGTAAIYNDPTYTLLYGGVGQLGYDVVVPPTPPVVTGYPVHVNSNIDGATVFMDGSAVGVADWTSAELLTGSHTFAVMDIATLVTPLPQTVDITHETTIDLNYTSAAGTTIGGGSGIVATGEVDVVTPVLTLGGMVNAPGLLVVTQITPGKAAYAGYTNVWTVYQVWASDVAMLNGGSLIFNYASTTPTYFAAHWGNYYPGPAPNQPGYAFNGAANHGFMLGDAPFTAATYTPGVLTLAPIPFWGGKGPGTFEVILNLDPNTDLPVELSSFTAALSAQMFVNLQWTTESETNNLGFNVYRSTIANDTNPTKVNLNMIGGTNSSTTHNYSFVDDQVEPETTYYYWLEMVPLNGQSTFSTSVMVSTVGGGSTPTPVTATVLNNAYPNPFRANGSTNIDVSVKAGDTATLTIFNVLGQTVKTYNLSSGVNNKITWNGRDYKNAVCGSGIYFYKLTSASVNQTKKMIIVR